MKLCYLKLTFVQRYEGEFEDDTFSGQGTITYNDGSAYTGTPFGLMKSQIKFDIESTGHFRKGLYEGQGLLRSRAGGTHDGYFRRGVPYGIGMMIRY